MPVWLGLLVACNWFSDVEPDPDPPPPEPTPEQLAAWDDVVAEAERQVTDDAVRGWRSPWSSTGS